MSLTCVLRPSSSRNLLPLSQCGRVVLFEGIAVAQLTVEVEAVVDRGMNGGEHRAESVSRQPHRLVANVDPALEQHILDLAP